MNTAKYTDVILRSVSDEGPRCHPEGAAATEGPLCAEAGTQRPAVHRGPSLRCATLRMTVFVALLSACSKQEAPKTPPVPVETAKASTIAAPLTIEANGVV